LRPHSLPLLEYKLFTFKMANIDATTPQLKVVKGFTNAVVSRDLNNVEPILSRDFTMRLFPKVARLPDLTKEEYLQRYGGTLALFANTEVIFHEVIEAPGKVVTHSTLVSTTADGTTVDHDAVTIFSFIDEDEELKILEIKAFHDPEKREKYHAEVVKLLAKGIPVA